jgi:hypothetical protein
LIIIVFILFIYEARKVLNFSDANKRNVWAIRIYFLLFPILFLPKLHYNLSVSECSSKDTLYSHPQQSCSSPTTIATIVLGNISHVIAVLMALVSAIVRFRWNPESSFLASPTPRYVQSLRALTSR